MIAAPGTITRSYDEAGWTLEWAAPALARNRFACDVEGPMDDQVLLLSGVLGKTRSFREAWVLAEIASKLLDIPILEWLHLHRSGRTPMLPRGSRGLIVRRAAGDRVLAFGSMPAWSVVREWPARHRSAWIPRFGFDRVLVTGERPEVAPRGVASWEVH